VTPNRPAVRALVLAVVSLAVPVVPAVAALVLAVRAARRPQNAPGEAGAGRGVVTAAVALSAVGLVVWTGLAAAVVLVPTRHEEPMSVAASLEVPPTTAPPTTAVPTTVVPIDAPPTTVAPDPTTTADERWLEALDRLSTKLDEPFAEQTFDLTPAKTRSLEKLFRGCSRTLARLGSPSDRLRPAYRLARQACAQYDKAVKCLATAASLPEGPRKDLAFDCAFTAQWEGSLLLSQAEAEGLMITAEGG